MKRFFRNLLGKSCRSMAKTMLLMSALFGALSAAFLILTPEKLPQLINSMAAFASKGYSLPNANGQQVIPESDIKALKAFSKTFVAIGKQTRPALVYIESKKLVEMRQNPLEDFFFGFPGFGAPPNQGRGQNKDKGIQQGAGSGFIVDLKNGYIITNNHVVEDSSELRVQTFDNRWFTAKVVGTHKETDVAVIKLDKFEPQNLKQVTLADSDSVEVGDWVIALGAPFGLTQSLTVGVVSATGRAEVIKEGSSIEDFIQTDAAINPGNSGGPLLNIEGKVVGINTAIYSRTGSYSGIGFSVPSNMVKTVAESLINDGKVVRGFVGLGLTEKPEGSGLPDNVQGALVAKVYPNTPAERAGIKPYDLIVSFEGTPVTSQGEVRRKIALTKPGSEVSLGILRDGKTLTTKIKIGDYDAEGKKAFGEKDGQQNSENPAAANSALQEFGINAKDLTPDLKKNYNIRAKSGVIIAAIAENSPASVLFEEGDVIVEVDRKSVKNKQELNKILADSKKKSKDIVFTIERDGIIQLVVMRNR